MRVRVKVKVKVKVRVRASERERERERERDTERQGQREGERDRSNAGGVKGARPQTLHVQDLRSYWSHGPEQEACAEGVEFLFPLGPSTVSNEYE